MKKQLGYEEFSITNDAGGILYDPEEEDNLPKKLSELDVESHTFLTIMDEQDEEPRVNLVLAISNQDIPEEDSPVALTESFVIARKLPQPQAKSGAEDTAATDTNIVNGNHKHDEVEVVDKDTQNGNGVAAGSKRKRDLADSGTEADMEANLARKKGKVFEESTPATGVSKDEAVVVEDDGFIMIDDD